MTLTCSSGNGIAPIIYLVKSDTLFILNLLKCNPGDPVGFLCYL
jgi:hypothetical protein